MPWLKSNGDGGTTVVMSAWFSSGGRPSQSAGCRIHRRPPCRTIPVPVRDIGISRRAHRGSGAFAEQRDAAQEELHLLHEHVPAPA